MKILKKHDKRSSLALRLPILVNVLRQPFYSTEILSQLVRATEQRFHDLAARLRQAGCDAGGASVQGEGDGNGVALPPLMQPLPPPPEGDDEVPPEAEVSMNARTRAALLCWEALRKSQSLGQPQPGLAPPTTQQDDGLREEVREQGACLWPLHAPVLTLACPPLGACRRSARRSSGRGQQQAAEAHVRKAQLSCGTLYDKSVDS